MSLRERMRGLFVSERAQNLEDFIDKLSRVSPQIIGIKPFAERREWGTPRISYGLNYTAKTTAQRIILHEYLQALEKNNERNMVGTSRREGTWERDLEVYQYRTLATAINRMDDLAARFPQAQVHIVTADGVMPNEELAENRQLILDHRILPFTRLDS